MLHLCYTYCTTCICIRICHFLYDDVNLIFFVKSVNILIGAVCVIIVLWWFVLVLAREVLPTLMDYLEKNLVRPSSVLVCYYRNKFVHFDYKCCLVFVLHCETCLLSIELRSTTSFWLIQQHKPRFCCSILICSVLIH